MAAKRKPIDQRTAADLGLDGGQVGAAGSRLEVLSVAFPEAGTGAQMIDGDPATAARTLVDKLRKEARVL
jgi:electron transfer flavoprotein beta subunit